MTKRTLGELEHQVLLTVLRLGNDAYCAEVVVELDERTGRSVAAAAVYIALRRLEESGLVESSKRVSEGRGGERERRWFAVTAAGVELLRDSRRQMLELWDGLEPILADR